MKKSRDQILDMMVEVYLNDEDSFLIIKETLTRIGIASKKDNSLWQSCHLFHRQGKYYIVHFLEMLEYDGRDVTMSENDIARRNTIANLLEEWELVRLVDWIHTSTPVVPVSSLTIVPFNEKKNYTLKQKYSIGKKH